MQDLASLESLYGTIKNLRYRSNYAACCLNKRVLEGLNLQLALLFRYLQRNNLTLVDAKALSGLTSLQVLYVVYHN